MLESLTRGPMPAEVIPGSLVVPGSILESAMLAWLGSDVMGPSTVDTSTHTHSLVTRGGPFWLKWCSLTLGYPPRSRLAIFNGKCQWMEL